MNDDVQGASDITSIPWVQEGYEESGVEWPVSGDATVLADHNFYGEGGAGRTRKSSQ